jgi:type IV pilus assembly protein PilY1
MKRSRKPFLRTIPPLLQCILIALSSGASEAAVLEQYCQYPPYVVQTVLPSVTLLVSNSQSMLNFAYGDGANPCDNSAAPCGGFDPSRKYYGLFDSNYWYTGATGGGGGFTKAGLVGGTATSPTGGGTSDWHGNFLNWLTTRRVDAMRKVLTGGTGSATEACGASNVRYKKFSDNKKFTPESGNDIPVTFSYSTNCSGTLLSKMTVEVSANPPTYNVRNQSAGTTSGIIQEVTPKASVGIAFYNDSDSEGANLNPQVDGTNIPLSAYRNRIDTPSNFNGLTVGAPLGEALWTIVGQYARIGASSATGPRYHNGDYNPDKDPYFFHGGPSRCVKGSVVIISDGGPCNDGNLPTSYGGVDILNFADNTTFNCRGTDCFAAPGFPATTIPSCGIVNTNVAGVEDVALFAHTRDLRNSPTFGVDALANTQNLDIYAIRAFGQDNSNLLKYAAINGSFEDANGNGVPDAGEYGLDKAFFQADDGAAIEQALRDIFVNILRRATSGTAASVLASGEGSGANLVQAVFYPRRRFFDEVIEWTGTLQNLWYYVDPFFSGASIREDSNQDKVLNLITDNTVVYFFDTNSQTTKANRYANNTTTGRAQGTPTVVPFEQVKAIWEAGGFLHATDPSSRTIFTAIDNAVPRTPLLFTDSNASSLRSYLGAASDTEAAAIIRYVRGNDDVTGDGVIDFRQRTVPYPTSTSDNTVWKLGDIINSTPKIASRVPINTYEKVYSDKTYKSFTSSSVYLNRGMVFVGANDGMLHAFKLGKLEFPGDTNWPIPNPDNKDRARLRNLDSVPLGSERWAFIPKNAMPYLKAMLDNNYCHLYYVDLSPHLVDASIGAPPAFESDNAVRTSSSWRTILIGGMRYGGGCASPGSGRANAVDVPVAGVGYSSYFAIDVTNPESPSVLWEFSDPALGFATTGPAVVRINARNGSGVVDRSLNGKWIVVFGSGPTGPISDRQFFGKSDQTLKLFVVDLRTGALLRTIERDSNNATIANAFAGSLINSTADFNLDYQDDAVYIGYVKENAGVWNQGGVLRLQTKGNPDPANWETSRLVDDVGPVTSSIVRLQSNTWHTNWLFFGTGRYYYASANALDDATAQRHLYGVKDPCFTSGNTIDPSCATTVSAGSLQTVTDATIIDEAVANSSGFPGWKIELDTTTSVDYDGTGAKNYQAERVITDPLATGSGVVFFTTFRPYGDDCSIGGRTFLWGVRYNTGGIPLYALQGRALIQVSTASVEQLDLGDAFSRTPSGAVDTLHRGGRRSYALEGVPPTAQGLSLQIAPSALKRILHMKER